MSKNLVELMTGDTSLSEQFLSTFRRGEPLEPEKALLIAVLDDKRKLIARRWSERSALPWFNYGDGR